MGDRPTCFSLRRRRAGVLSDRIKAVDLEPNAWRSIARCCSAAAWSLHRPCGRATRAPALVRLLLRLAGSACGYNIHCLVDVYVETVIAACQAGGRPAPLGGASYRPYGVGQIAAICRRNGVGFRRCSGRRHARPRSGGTPGRCRPMTCIVWWPYLVHGGPANASNFLACAAFMLEAGDHRMG